VKTAIERPGRWCRSPGRSAWSRFRCAPASALTSKRPPVGTNMDLDAVKLRISRDKVMLKAEWTFN
jgi:hypothetical protein